jgi:cytochrome c
MPLHSIAQERLGLGQPLTADSLAGWDIDIAADGKGLPVGQGNASQGAVLYAQKCQACHGEKGVGGPANKLAGGVGTLNGSAPLKSIGSFWPYATTLFDYIRRAMPLNAPQSLNADQVYALSAYLLFLNGIVDASMTIDSSSLPRVKMPNGQGFKPVVDSLPK